MSDQSLDQLLEAYQVLKTSPHFQVTEEQTPNGFWSVVIHEQLSTANPFPGVVSQYTDLQTAQVHAIQEFQSWEADSRACQEEMAKSPKPPPHEVQIIQLLTEIRDELRKANKKPLYVVVNNEEGMKQFIEMVRAQERTEGE